MCVCVCVCVSTIGNFHLLLLTAFIFKSHVPIIEYSLYSPDNILFRDFYYVYIKSRYSDEHLRIFLTLHKKQKESSDCLSNLYNIYTLKYNIYTLKFKRFCPPSKNLFLILIFKEICFIYNTKYKTSSVTFNLV